MRSREATWQSLHHDSREEIATAFGLAMTEFMLSIRRLFKSFHYASRGIAIAWKYEQSFRIQVTAALVATALMIWLSVTLWQAIALILLIILVLTLELINSILERFVDVFKPRIHPMVEEIKDLMAGAVLIASVGALIVGLLIFMPYLL